MRKYGCSKRNPDPKWPCEQAVVAVPADSAVATAAKVNGTLRIMESQIPSTPEINPSDSPHSRDEQTPIMGYMTQPGQSLSRPDCGKTEVSSYLCQSIGSYAKVEFLFGENVHVEKTGVMENVGKDFIVLSEAGTGTKIVSSLKNIKFINIYNINNR
ncbi:MAG: hypothetical protein IJE62_07715 [Clostridia bacterium]|nr:hypothetical protein [Clostridia bacterium]